MVVRFEGHLDTNTAPEAQARLDALADGGVEKIVIDCSDLDYISSAGLRVLLVTTKKAFDEAIRIDPNQSEAREYRNQTLRALGRDEDPDP